MDGKKAAIIAAVAVIIIAGVLFFLLRSRTGREEISPEKPARETIETEEVDEIENMLKLARYYLDKEEYDLARTQLEQVLIRDPANTEAQTLLDETIAQKKVQDREDEEDDGAGSQSEG